VKGKENKHATGITVEGQGVRKMTKAQKMLVTHAKG